MSASVWFEEVSRGLLNELKNTVKVKDQRGVLVTLSDKSFVVRKPEEEFKSEVYPCVSIYTLDSKYDPRRYYPYPVVVGQDKESKQVLLEDSAVPYNLTYQIDFWSQYQEDMDCMTRTWLMRHFRQFNLKVVDDGGVERSCNAQVIGKLVRNDLVKNNDRLFHSSVKYDIWVEIDDEIRYNKPMVTDIDIKTREGVEGGKL